MIGLARGGLVSWVLLAAACVRPPPPPVTKPVALDVATWRPHYRIEGDRLIASATITNSTRTHWTDTPIVLVAPAVTCLPEDIDEFEDDDGCADEDNDRDSLPDRDDTCPDEPESYNGVLDGDGCPDRGRIVTQPLSTEVLEQLFFAKGKAAIERNAEAMLTSIASVLATTPEIGRLEVRGHAVAGEPTRIGLQRAVAVRAALIARGVRPAKLGLADAGTREPLGGRREPQGRVSFRVIERVDEVVPWPSVRPTPVADTVALSVPTRIPLAAVSLRRGATTTVQLFDVPVKATLELWFLPERSVVHPMRTLTVTNSAPVALPRGPVTWSGGGEGALEPVAPSSAVRIELGLDRTTTLTATPTIVSTSTRIVAVRGVRIDVEDAVSLRTTFTAPAGPVVQGLAPLVANHKRQRTLGLPEDRTDLTPFLASLPDDLVTRLIVVIALRNELSAAEAGLAAIVDEVSRALPRPPAALVKRFDETSARVEALQTRLRGEAMELRYP